MQDRRDGWEIYRHKPYPFAVPLDPDVRADILYRLQLRFEANEQAQSDQLKALLSATFWQRLFGWRKLTR